VRCPEIRSEELLQTSSSSSPPAEAGELPSDHHRISQQQPIAATFLL
jgi:hypothetical protein